MNSIVKRSCLLGGLALLMPLIAGANAEISPGDSNPYAVISDRNVFHLNPPPPPEEAAPLKPPDLQKVQLSGFQKIGENIKVYLAIPAKDPKDTAYLALQAGEKGNDVEIVKIREEKGEVDIINSGTPMTLTLASNGVATSGGGGAAAPRGGGPPSPGFNHRMMPGMPRNNPMASAPAPSPAPTTMGGSAIVIGGSGDSSSSSPYTSGGGSSSYSGGVTVSGGSSYGGGGVTAAGANNASAQIANALFNNGAGQNYRPPTPDVAPAPAVQQAAGLLIYDAAGGPPAPVGPDGGPPVPRER